MESRSKVVEVMGSTFYCEDRVGWAVLLDTRLSANKFDKLDFLGYRVAEELPKIPDGRWQIERGSQIWLLAVRSRLFHCQLLERRCSLGHPAEPGVEFFRHFHDLRENG
jgi:hypothetical protein